MVTVMDADMVLKFDRRRFTRTLLLMIINKPGKFVRLRRTPAEIAGEFSGPGGMHS
jgi:hypothetical protein